MECHSLDSFDGDIWNAKDSFRSPSIIKSEILMEATELHYMTILLFNRKKYLLNKNDIQFFYLYCEYGGG